MWGGTEELGTLEEREPGLGSWGKGEVALGPYRGRAVTFPAGGRGWVIWEWWESLESLG